MNTITQMESINRSNNIGIFFTVFFNQLFKQLNSEKECKRGINNLVFLTNTLCLIHDNIFKKINDNSQTKESFKNFYFSALRLKNNIGYLVEDKEYFCRIENELKENAERFFKNVRLNKYKNLLFELEIILISWNEKCEREGGKMGFDYEFVSQTKDFKWFNLADDKKCGDFSKKMISDYNNSIDEYKKSMRLRTKKTMRRFFRLKI
ncbi:hypothetical protein TUBRATIS_004330 [Tubulinosema ratisbonensis]|uniref:Uncharacterized protein n=1 Tax=Tubulinosema ratisbonensis TaxID=291195 RepID=A0A437APZ2_9MICR|nr:hypothetical protein TUBRATIS_004330 [Tubulinosema ratisbonensis]